MFEKTQREVLQEMNDRQKAMQREENSRAERAEERARYNRLSSHERKFYHEPSEPHFRALIGIYQEDEYSLEESIEYAYECYMDYRNDGITPREKRIAAAREKIATDYRNSFFIDKVSQKYKKKVNDSTYIDAEGGKYMVEATINFSEYVNDLKNDKLLISNEGINISNQFTSDLIKDYASAVKQHNNNRSSIAKRIFNENANEGLRRFNNSVNDKYGYPLYYYYIAFARGRGKKFDYSDLSRSFENIERIKEIIKIAFSG